MKKLIGLLGLLLLSVLCAAQAAVEQFGDGLTPYGSFHGGKIDNVNLQSRTLTIYTPILSYKQRGALELGYALTYSSRVQGWKEVSGGDFTAYDEYYSLDSGPAIGRMDRLSGQVG